MINFIYLNFYIVTAIICGYVIGLYTDSDFDAISGAVGILFVHDLDERVFASMKIISRSKKSAMCKKLSAVALWIVVSVALSVGVACKYTNNSYFPDSDNPCLQGEFQCGTLYCYLNIILHVVSTLSQNRSHDIFNIRRMCIKYIITTYNMYI